MRLLNFSIGCVQAVQIGAEIVRTAHLKEPVSEPWRVTEEGAKGDERAVHPDKIYAFARSAYQYWGAQLGVDPAKWPDGFFGENLTLDDLDDADLRVGDVFAVGDDVRLVVSGARTPCVKLAWRLNQPRSFQKTFAKSRHTGAYFGVLTPGQVRPGDRFERIEHDSEMPSVADICDFIDSHRPPPLKALNRLLSSRHLSPANRMLLGAKKELAERAEDAVENRWRGWRRFVVSRVKDEAEDIKSVSFTPSDQGALCAARPGQFVSVKLESGEGRTVTRTWSLSSFAHEPQEYRVTVLRQDGEGSRALHGLKTGDAVELRAPAGNFALDMGSFHPLVLIAAGVGITPLMAMLEAQLTKRQAGYIHLIYGAKTRARMAFHDEMQALQEKHPDLRLTYAFSRSEEADRPSRRITAQLVKEALADLHVTLGDRRIDLPWFEADFYICGPNSLCGDIKSALIGAGANPSHVYTEQFSGALPMETETQSAQVEFSRSKKKVDWTASANLSLLELAEEAGIALASDCRAGACFTCKATLLEGATTADTGDGSVLLCIGRPKTKRLVIDA